MPGSAFFCRWTYWACSYSCGADFPGLRPSAAAPRSRRLPFLPGCPSAPQTGSWSPLWTGRWAWRLSCIAPGRGSEAAGTPFFLSAPGKQRIHYCKDGGLNKPLNLARRDQFFFEYSCFWVFPPWHKGILQHITSSLWHLVFTCVRK